MARARNAAEGEKTGGGGKSGMAERGGDTAAKIAAGQAEKAERERKKARRALLHAASLPHLCTPPHAPA